MTQIFVTVTSQSKARPVSTKRRPFLPGPAVTFCKSLKPCQPNVELIPPILKARQLRVFGPCVARPCDAAVGFVLDNPSLNFCP
ncbi:hypothetical protein PoB_005177700 [Plakobranchus ocellatus]|uniref:Uncharacterized protein n=1 Tax=Plakobranchus ocellatus TaxID=259542 RepID=A0AAV4C100_9GAST|nr:hypothetical protein PoB_005177700 [Plakobranchus ocellatus]